MARQSFIGFVTSQGKMNKTIKVRVRKVKFNRVIHKDIIEYKDFMVHDELNKCQEGDVVRIQYVRPLSAHKSFAVAEIMKYKGTEWMKYQAEAPQKVTEEELKKLEEYKLERQARIEAKGTSSIAENIRKVEKSFAGDKSLAESDKPLVQDLMKKYGISSWPPSHEIIKLDASKLKKELQELDIEISALSYSSYTKDFLASQPEEADKILQSLGHDTTTMNSSIKKNILMKHFAKSFNSIPVA
ncbi:mitochondrial 37S ribosomal protein MRPS17 [Sugiyamaella lignohabitans]|uniref:Mitochondrial 37S ribosomal protein MRPS17 n=1 Tax=Sugiyamaella lignohabitans TaxID=796027 RepID=A0A167EFZ9_9ASCO|nr:mitochondrial 37S ribosomal protein MRPS17 [Sugiyamaella lignohabitans]ANB14034.1 mitochondrial 37S ribosomal protein MRPS17 [Sugiyamaella lignohabitans]